MSDETGTLPVGHVESQRPVQPSGIIAPSVQISRWMRAIPKEQNLEGTNYQHVVGLGPLGGVHSNGTATRPGTLPLAIQLCAREAGLRCEMWEKAETM